MHNNDIKSILLVGVGGQGTILASKILAYIAMEQGLDVKISEIHGMAQRGGSVVTQVRMGPVVSSPLVEKGQADYIMAMEVLEGWRWLPYLKKDGVIVASRQSINPMPVITGKQDYPQGLEEKISSQVKKSYFLDAFPIAVKVGQPKAANVVLLGALLKQMGMPGETGHKALESLVPARFLEQNKQAFDMGYKCHL